MKILLLLFIFIKILFGFSVEGSFEAARQKAFKEKKVMMVLLTTKDSVSSKQELQKIINNKKLRKLIEKKAVFVIVYKEQKESYPIEMLYTKSIPSLFFLDSNELFICKELYAPMKQEAIMRCLE